MSVRYREPVMVWTLDPRDRRPCLAPRQACDRLARWMLEVVDADGENETLDVCAAHLIQIERFAVDPKAASVLSTTEGDA